MNDPHDRGAVGSRRASPLHRRVAYAAVVELADDVLVVALSPELLAVRDLAGKVGAVVVVLGPEARDDEGFARRVAGFLGAWQVAETSVVILGSERRGSAFAEAATPAQRRGKLFFSGVDEAGARWGEGDAGPLAPKLAAALAPDARLDWAAFEARVQRSSQRAKEQRGFAVRLQARRPVVTWTLLAANLGMFALELARGGAAPSVRVLVRLGGVAQHLVERGELWRLVSGAFLHGSVMHLAFNLFVLYVLGGFVERLLGPARFLILYTASAIAGSLATTWLAAAVVSVGASGALWGILAAEAVFALAPGFLPAVAVAGARRTALINLGLNAAASTLPHVDWAAHAGGGVVGATLVYFVLSKGVPRGEALATRDVEPRRGLTIAAWLCGAVLALGAAAGPVLGGGLFPVGSAPTWERVPFADGPATVEVPAGLRATPPRRGDEGRVDQAFGDVFVDPTAVGITRIPLPGPLDAEGEMERLLEALGDPPEGARVSRAAERVEDPSFGAAAEVSYRYGSGLGQDVFVGLTPDAVVRVESLYWLDAAAYADGVARRVAGSLEPR